ncbi:MAG: type IX secretion system membrane protein PorP/SprF [Bacteroidales bacterium]|nr:type IX secretion system membrane protein PorP/SprF [Bacteroidales bacterium]
MQKYITIALVLFLSIELSAQQIPLLSQYTLNHYSINPAATGVSDGLPLTFTYRKQWAGIKGSPSTQYLSGDMNIAKSMGVGAKFFNYQAGPMRKTGMELTYSYHVDLNPENKLAFGLSGLFYQFYLDKSRLTVEDTDDDVFSGVDRMVVADASFGTYLYGEYYYVGISVPQLFNRNIDLKTDKVLQEKQVRHYYLFGGYKFFLNRYFTLEPSLMFKFVEAGLWQVDVNARAEYKEMFSLGVSFRSSEAIIAQLGFAYEEFFIGYSYDFAIGDLHTATFGSHEVLLIYTFPNFIR